MSENEKLSILDQLEQEFEGEKSPHKPVPEKKNNRFFRKKATVPHLLKNKKIAVLCIAVVLILCFAAGAAFLIKTGNSAIKKEAPDFLTKKKKKDWDNKEVDKNEIFIYVNTNLEVKDGNKVQLRLANPPYCAYPAQIDITDIENKTVYYTSEILKPGQSLEEVKLKDIPEKKGTYDVSIRYTFYSESEDTEVGEHTVRATLLIK